MGMLATTCQRRVTTRDNEEEQETASVSTYRGSNANSSPAFVAIPIRGYATGDVPVPRIVTSVLSSRRFESDQGERVRECRLLSNGGDGGDGAWNSEDSVDSRCDFVNDSRKSVIGVIANTGENRVERTECTRETRSSVVTANSRASLHDFHVIGNADGPIPVDSRELNGDHRGRRRRGTVSQRSRSSVLLVAIAMVALCAPVSGVPMPASRADTLLSRTGPRLGLDGTTGLEDVYEDAFEDVFREEDPTTRNVLQESELEIIRRSIVRGLGLKRIPDPSKVSTPPVPAFLILRMGPPWSLALIAPSVPLSPTLRSPFTTIQRSLAAGVLVRRTAVRSRTKPEPWAHTEKTEESSVSGIKLTSVAVGTSLALEATGVICIPSISTVVVVAISMDKRHQGVVERANVSQAEYERAHREYLKKVHLSTTDEHSPKSRKSLHVFHATAHPGNGSSRIYETSSEVGGGGGQYRHRLFFPVEIPGTYETSSVDHATLRLLLHGHYSERSDVDVLLYLRTYGARRLLIRRRIAVRDSRDSRWLEFDSTVAVSSWLEPGVDNLGLELEFRRNDDRPVRRTFSSPVLNVFTESISSATNGRAKRSTPEELMFLHQGRRTNCKGESKKCCRHELTVMFKDLKGFEFIVYPKMFDAGYCKGRCPPRYNPANHHALLQSLLWKEDRKKVPKPCCAPSKLDQLMIVYFDENDATQLKVSYWKDIQVLECACS
ncbi:Bone morphogenetic protein 5 [Dufourea novaeangliae]|uniref:Bone morphogenetic protein 5 n=1 Tax=Dufourea novaeangliae TaxID=178035 RepID=A0A154PKD2_DUFNO|nr:Bone morphogenetic protein 5 [Dufourea novaeangliae]